MRIFLGYVFIALSALLVLALASFNPMDSIWLTSKVNSPPGNIAGILGVWLSTPLVILYGKYSSFLLNFGILTIGVNLLIGSKIGRILVKATLFVIATISLSVILATVINGVTYIEAGLMGLAVSSSLKEVFPSPIIIVLFAFIFIVSLLSTMKLFKEFSYWIARAMGWILLLPFHLFGIIGGSDEEKEGDFLEEKVFSPDMEQKKKLEVVDKGPEVQVKEPHFLKPEKETLKQSIKLKEDSPVWLKDEKEKKAVLAEVNHLFDKEIEERKPIEVLSKDSALVPAEEKMEEKDLLFKPEEIKMVPVKEVDNNKLPPEVIKEEDTLEVEEIVGEADYSEVAKSRNKESEEPFDLFPEEEVVKDYVFPDVNVLEKSLESYSRLEESEEIDKVSKIIETTFASFKIDIKVSGYSRGPAITRYEIIPPSGLKLKNIVNLTDDLALNLGTRNIRIVAPIGNRSIIGVEVPNRHRKTVALREIIASEEYKNTKAKLPLILGKDIAGNIIVEDLTEMPHLLIAGTTGSGKSVYVNSFIGGIVFKKSSEDVKFIFIDPKMVELELYNGIPHLLAPVINDPEEAIAVLEWASQEMDRRYKVLSDFGVRNMLDYNMEIKRIKASKRQKEENNLKHFPYIIIVIDEFANLMLRLPKETEKVITRIAAMARAVGIHLVVATQRPSVDVVTGIIKANFPSRIAFRVSSQTDSRTILDKSGAEKLLGKGDMLFMTPNFTDMIRIQSPFVSNADVENLVRELKRNGTAEYVINPEELMEKQSSEEMESEYSADYRQDPIFIESLKAAVENREVSASFLQRRFRIGYNRASRIIEAMEKLKILGPSTGSSKPREVLISQEDLVHYLNP